MAIKQVQIDPTAQKNIDLWLNGHYDAETKKQIQRLVQENPKEAVDAFYKNLNFGTGGLRGIMGVGSNRMNQYTVGTATQGLANYVKKQPAPPQGHSVLIGYDSRHHSRFFAEVSAKILAGNGIRAYVYEEIHPTPLVSFGCRYKRCSAAIMITASHNPSEYNGYKVYWNDGAQVLPPHDKNIIAEVNAITDVTMIKQVDSLSHPLIEWISTEVDDAYVSAIFPLQNYPDDNRAHGSNLRVVYTPLHGTGITSMPAVLTSWGFLQFILVDEQCIPDGFFPTVKVPNPEYPEALKMGIKKLQDEKGDILIATDPDADRVAVAVRHGNSVELLTGNQVACLCLQHICEAMSARAELPSNAAFVKTIGTTELFQAIADTYHRPCFNVLTGFKYIAEKIRQWERDPNGYQYIFGGEESYGYLYGTLARDKDAILSGALICEMALHAKRQKKTLVDLLHDLFRRYGVFSEKLLSIDFEESKAGEEQMTAAMVKLRQAPPKQINGVDVIAIEDYLTSLKRDLRTGKSQPITLPRSDVLLFWLADESKVMVRPSGTEPKVKLYCGVVNRNKLSIPNALTECDQRATRILNDLKKHF